MILLTEKAVYLKNLFRQSHPTEKFKYQIWYICIKNGTDEPKMEQSSKISI